MVVAANYSLKDLFAADELGSTVLTCVEVDSASFLLSVIF